MGSIDSSYSDFKKTIDFLVKLLKRLEYDTVDIDCRKLVIHMRRINILAKYINLLRKQEEELMDKYEEYYGKYSKYKKMKKIVIRASVGIVIGTATIMALLSILVPNPSSFLYFLFPQLPLIMVSGASIIAVTVVVGTIFIASISRRAELELLEKKIHRLNEWIEWFRWRKNVLEKELERSIKYRHLPKEYSICRCYDEFNELIEKLRTIELSIKVLTKCRDEPECFRKYVNNILKNLEEIKKYKEICNTRYTYEFWIKVKIDDELINGLEKIVNNELEDLPTNGYLRIFIRGREKPIDLLNIIKNMLEKR